MVHQPIPSFDNLRDSVVKLGAMPRFVYRPSGGIYSYKGLFIAKFIPGVPGLVKIIALFLVAYTACLAYCSFVFFLKGFELPLE